MTFRELSDGLFDRPGFRGDEVLDDLDRAMDSLATAWIKTVAANLPIMSEPDALASLPALFDLMCSALYARETLGLNPRADRGRALRCGGDVVFPYTWMCPLCVARGETRTVAYLPGARREVRAEATRLYPDVDFLSKPASRFIGDVGIKVLQSVLRVMLSKGPHALRMAHGGGRRGEFDLTLASTTQLLLAEVKAKPLISFPLVSRGDAASSGAAVGHEWLGSGVRPAGPLEMYVAAANLFLSLGRPDGPTWPLGQLQTSAHDVAVVMQITSAWRAHLDAYRTWAAEPDALRWHRFGCGNFAAIVDGVRVEHRVANTKELPGLDRTDDIKKGTAQVLLMSRYKMNCRIGAVKTGLLGNLYAETHGRDYLDHLAKMQVREVDVANWVWIFDAILGLSKNVFRDAELENALGTMHVLGRFMPSAG